MWDQAFSRQWSVPQQLEGIRLDAFARQCLPHLSRRQLNLAIRDGLFLINGAVGKKGTRLKGGDLLMYRGPEDWLQNAPAALLSHDFKVAYEDVAVLVVEKPAGMATHGFSARDRSTLANLLIGHRPGLASIGSSRWQPGLLHRLDKGTSGLVLVAKTARAFEHLRLQFRNRRIEKTYWALVWGTPAAEGVVSYALTHDSRGKGRMKALVSRSGPDSTQKSWPAVTRFRRLAGARGLSLLEIHMRTGVTHQIRVHLAAIGHPIVGEETYGSSRQERFGLNRHFLHAACLSFMHPDDERRLTVKSQLPAELQDLLERLGISV